MKVRIVVLCYFLVIGFYRTGFRVNYANSAPAISSLVYVVNNVIVAGIEKCNYLIFNATLFSYFRLGIFLQEFLMDPLSAVY